MKATSDKAFNLIKSLNGHEKRDFKTEIQLQRLL